MNREHRESLSHLFRMEWETIDVLSDGDEAKRESMEYRMNSHKVKMGVTEIVNWCRNRIDNIGCCKDSPSVKQEGEHLLHFIKTLLHKHFDSDDYDWKNRQEYLKETVDGLDRLLTEVIDRLDAGEISTERNVLEPSTYFVENNLLDDEEDDEEQEWRRVKSEERRKFLQEERKKEQQAEEERRNNLTDKERELEEQERQARTRATRRRSRKEEN